MGRAGRSRRKGPSRRDSAGGAASPPRGCRDCSARPAPRRFAAPLPSTCLRGRLAAGAAATGGAAPEEPRRLSRGGGGLLEGLRKGSGVELPSSLCALLWGSLSPPPAARLPTGQSVMGCSPKPERPVLPAPFLPGLAVGLGFGALVDAVRNSLSGDRSATGKGSAAPGSGGGVESWRVVSKSQICRTTLWKGRGATECPHFLPQMPPTSCLCVAVQVGQTSPPW